MNKNKISLIIGLVVVSLLSFGGGYWSRAKGIEMNKQRAEVSKQVIYKDEEMLDVYKKISITTANEIDDMSRLDTASALIKAGEVKSLVNDITKLNEERNKLIKEWLK